MALIPSIFGGRRSNVSDPFSLDVFNRFHDFPLSGNETTAMANVRIDWKETPEAHVFKADMPGLKKEEVKVEVEDGRVLHIVLCKKQEKKNDRFHVVETSSVQLSRRFKLPENAKMEQLKAGMKNGVLTVTVPKEQVKKPEVMTLNISG